MKIKSINPATGEINETYLLHTLPIVNDIINSVDLAQKEWVATSFIERSMLMRNAAKLLRKQKPTLAQLITHEMGKVIRELELKWKNLHWYVIITLTMPKFFYPMRLLIATQNQVS